MARALKHFLLEPLRRKHPPLLMFRLAQMLHERTNGGFDALYEQWAHIASPPVALPESDRLSKNEITDIAADLHRDGYRILPITLSRESCDQLHAYAFSAPAYADHPSEKIKLDEAALLKGGEAPRYMWPCQDLIRLPAVQDLLRDTFLPGVAQHYFGSRPLLTSVNLWLDPPSPNEFAAHIYHYDNDGARSLKFFFYINDVDADNGPHRFIKGSHHRRKPASFQMAKRYSDDDLLSFYGADRQIVFTAAAGTILAEDTCGFHRGTTVKRGYRLLLQIQYATIDIPGAEEFLTRIERAPLPGAPREIAPIVRKFFEPA